jgi:hypothetical protein
MKYDVDYIIGGRYPGSRLRYDFYLPEHHEYIEIAGTTKQKSQAYKERMIAKQKAFGSLILWDSSEYEAVLMDLIQQIDIDSFQIHQIQEYPIYR